jgi:hypothetical protein
VSKPAHTVPDSGREQRRNPKVSLDSRSVGWKHNATAGWKPAVQLKLLGNIITGKCWNDEPHQSFDQKEKKSSNAEAFHPTNCGTFSFAWFFHLLIK